MGLVHHPWENQIKPKQLRWWDGGLFCTAGPMRGSSLDAVLSAGSHRGPRPSYNCKRRTSQYFKIKQLKATFSLTLFLRREYMSSCPIRLSFYSPSVRAWGETGLETWLSHVRRIWFIAWSYISIVFNIDLLILSNYDLWTSLGAIIKARFNFFKQLVHTGNTAFFFFLFFNYCFVVLFLWAKFIWVFNPVN